MLLSEMSRSMMSVDWPATAIVPVSLLARVVVPVSSASLLATAGVALVPISLLATVECLHVRLHHHEAQYK